MSRCDIYLLFIEIVYGDYLVCLYLCIGVCCVVEYVVLGGGVLFGRLEIDIVVVRIIF